ncbi:MAG TPA: sigma-54 dependent transcriptional regulator [Terriglobia bacterium]|nr:sigma-54 dependent transcriptional regulator [Terriglobia bacterium]
MMEKSKRILIVDDDKGICQWLSAVLTAEAYDCRVAHDRPTAEVLLVEESFDLALVDIYLGKASGLELLERIKTLQPECDCVVMTANASVETVARAVSEGAIEYLGKPLLIDELMSLIHRLEEHRTKPQAAPEILEQDIPDSMIVGHSAKMLEVYRAIVRVAMGDASVLIVGASGTGKELVARAIHAHSPRANKLFTPINCGSLSETLLESELFGHEKGAFTGADTSRRGLFEATNGGTIFLDEISETGLSFQVKLLRVLQERQVRRLGSNTYIDTDVRILSATNRDLPVWMHDGKFREDLYYRLSVVTISLPSLAERREDIPLLVRHFLRSFNGRNSRQVTMTDEAMAMLGRRPWPGNVRELENVVERLAIFSTTDVITAADVESTNAPETAALPASEAPASTLKEMERQHILRALAEAQGNKSLAARRLGIERKTLYKKARRLGIDLGTEEP